MLRKRCQCLSFSWEQSFKSIQVALVLLCLLPKARKFSFLARKKVENIFIAKALLEPLRACKKDACTEAHNMIHNIELWQFAPQCLFVKGVMVDMS